MIFSGTIKTAIALAFTSVITLNSIESAIAHPTPVDDLMRPRLKVLSRSPMSVIVTIQPRENLSSATVETPNNIGGPLIQCAFGSLVANQSYECRLQGAVDADEPAFTIKVNGVITEQSGGRHFSSRSFAVTNPSFDRERFRAERREEASRGALLEQSIRRPRQ
jgi:hypothetical protein